MFEKFKIMSRHKQILFALLIGFAVISFWRGAWNLMDLYIFPNNYEVSSWISLIVGLIILFTTHYTTKELT